MTFFLLVKFFYLMYSPAIMIGRRVLLAMPQSFESHQVYMPSILVGSAIDRN